MYTMYDVSVGDAFRVLTLVNAVVEPTRALAVGLEGRELGWWRRRQSHRPSLSPRIEDRVGAYRVFVFVVSAMCECEATRSS